MQSPIPSHRAIRDALAEDASFRDRFDEVGIIDIITDYLFMGEIGRVFVHDRQVTIRPSERAEEKVSTYDHAYQPASIIIARTKHNEQMYHDICCLEQIDTHILFEIEEPDGEFRRITQLCRLMDNEMSIIHSCLSAYDAPPQDCTRKTYLSMRSSPGSHPAAKNFHRCSDLGLVYAYFDKTGRLIDQPYTSSIDGGIGVTFCEHPSARHEFSSLATSPSYMQPPFFDKATPRRMGQTTEPVSLESLCMMHPLQNVSMVLNPLLGSDFEATRLWLRTYRGTMITHGRKHVHSTSRLFRTIRTFEDAHLRRIEGDESYADIHSDRANVATLRSDMYANWKRREDNSM